MKGGIIRSLSHKARERLTRKYLMEMSPASDANEFGVDHRYCDGCRRILSIDSFGQKFCRNRACVGYFIRVY